MILSRARAVRRIGQGWVFAAAGSFLILAAPAAALADDSHTAIFAGGQLDFSNYVFMGATVALPGSTIGNGIALRGVVDTGGYDYINTDLGTVKANFGGGELDGVYQLTHKNLFADFFLGVNDTYTGLTPYDPTNRLRGNQVELRLGTDGTTVSGPWRVDWYGYYGPKLADYEAFLGGTHSLSESWRLGLEGYSEGNPTYSLYQLGPYAGFDFDKTSELNFSVGEAWESGFNARIYARAVYYRRL